MKHTGGLCIWVVRFFNFFIVRCQLGFKVNISASFKRGINVQGLGVLVFGERIPFMKRDLFT